jgi:omega-amidase
MQDLKVTVVQTELIWEDCDRNIARFDEIIDRIEETHLVILPEMFTTGFSMEAQQLAQTMNGSSVQWLREKSRKREIDITGSIIIEERGKYYNRLIWAKPDGGIFTYDKKHLFRISGEEKVYSAGASKVTVEINGWKLRPFICYDLRFPLWTRNLGNEYDVAIFIANWPEKRSAHWKVLLQARAVENQSYVVGVNRVGTDGKGFYHSGDSSIIDPRGEILFRKSHEECIHTEELSAAQLEEYRASFPFWMDADRLEDIEK